MKGKIHTISWALVVAKCEGRRSERYKVSVL